MQCICEGYVFQPTYSVQNIFLLLRVFSPKTSTCSSYYDLCLRSIFESVSQDAFCSQLSFWGAYATHFSWLAISLFGRLSPTSGFTRPSPHASACSHSGKASHSKNFTLFPSPHGSSLITALHCVELLFGFILHHGTTRIHLACVEVYTFTCFSLQRQGQFLHGRFGYYPSSYQNHTVWEKTSPHTSFEVRLCFMPSTSPYQGIIFFATT